MQKARTMPSEAHWKVTGILACVFALIFFWPLLGVICFAAIMAFLFYPLYSWMAKHVPSVVAVAGTLFISVCIVVIPLAISLMIAVAQGVSFAANVAETFELSSPASARHEMEEVIKQVNSVITPISNGQLRVSTEAVQDFFAHTLPVLVKSLVAVIVGFASSLPQVITFVTVYLFLFAAFLTSGKSTLEQLRYLSPFSSETTQLYFMRTGAMIKASMLGQLLIALILSVLTAFLLLLIDAGPYFLFLVILMTLLNMIPLGSGLIVYPMAIVAMLLGNVTGGIWVIIIYSFVICSLDNILRPRLIPKSVQLAPALMTIAIFCGIFYFGIIGVVYGPVIAIILLTTFETFIDYRQRMTTKRIKEVRV